MYLDEVAIKPAKRTSDQEFEMAVKDFKSKKYPLDEYVMLMALKNQALHGDNCNKRPEGYSMVLETFIHDAWLRLKGMSASEAKMEFIKLSSKTYQ